MSVRVLLIEDSADDADLILRELKREYDVVSARVQNEPQLRVALRQPWDVIICDHVLPGFGSHEAMRVIQDVAPKTPVILVSGTIGEALAAEAMRSGARDAVMKGGLDRLATVVSRELAAACARSRRDELERALGAIRDMALLGGLASDPSAIAGLAVTRLTELLGVTGVELYVGRDDALTLLAHYGGTVAADAVVRRGEGATGCALERGTPVAVNDYGAWEGALEHFRGSTGAALAVPVVQQERVAGVLTAFNARPREFTAEDIELVQAFAAGVVPYLSLADLFAANTQLLNEAIARTEQLERQTRRLEALAAFRRAALEACHVPEMVMQATTVIRDVTGADRVALLQLLADRVTLHPLAVAGLTTGEDHNDVHATPGTRAAFALESAEPIISSDVDQERRFAPGARARTLGARTTISMRISTESGVFGLVVVHGVRADHFAAEDPEFIGAVAGIIGSTVARLEAQASARASEERLRAVIQSAPIALWALDANGTLILADGQVITRFRENGIQGRGRSIFETLAGQEEAVGFARDALTSGAVSRRVPLFGRVLEVHASRFADAPHSGGVIGVAVDVTERAAAEDSLRASEARYRHIVETTVQGVWVIDTHGTTTFANAQMAGMLGRSVEEVVGHHVFEFMDSDLRELAAHKLAQRQAGIAEQHEFRFRRSDGTALWTHLSASPFTDASGQVIGALAMVTDITERKRNEAKIERLALYDTLTGLPNRTLFRDRLAQATELAHRSGRPLIAMFADLDDFKTINEDFGHTLADDLLRQVSDRLKRVVRSSDTLARLGGDEFAVLLPPPADVEDGQRLADRMLQAIRLPLVLDGRVVHIGISVGIAASPDHGHDADTLMRHCENALHAAKRSRAGTAFYLPDPGSRSGSSQVLSDLRAGLDRGELVLHYQPQRRLDTGEITGIEALVRWQHPKRGLLGPAEFLDVADRAGLLKPMTRHILRVALREWRALRWSGSSVGLSVNVPMSLAQDPELPEIAESELARADVPHDALTLEVTETTAMANAETVRANVRRLRALGIRVSIDDFGTGYSSLSYLATLEVHEVKADRSLVQGVATNATKAAVARAIVELGRGLGLVVVAEGVEEPADLSALASLGFHLVQGNAVAPPMALASLASWLEHAASGSLQLRTGSQDSHRLVPAMLELAQRAEPHLRGPDQAEWLRVLERDADSLRLAVETAIAESDQAALRLVTSLREHWLASTRVDEGRELCERALAAMPSRHDPRVWARASATAGVLTMHVGDLEGALGHLGDAAAMFEDGPEASDRCKVLIALAGVYQLRGEMDAAREHAQAAIAIARRLDDLAALGDCEGRLGAIALEAGEVESAMRRYGESLAIRRALGDARGSATSFIGLGAVALADGREADALGCYREALRLGESVGLRAEVTLAVEGIAAVCSARGDHNIALELWSGAALVREHVPIIARADRSRMDAARAVSQAALGPERSALARAQGIAMSESEWRGRAKSAVAAVLGGESSR